MKPTLRSDIAYDLINAIQNIDAIYKSCLNCDNFKELQELCKLANMRPPAKVIAYGCKAWEPQDLIPY